MEEKESKAGKPEQKGGRGRRGKRERQRNRGGAPGKERGPEKGSSASYLSLSPIPSGAQYLTQEGDYEYPGIVYYTWGRFMEARTTPTEMIATWLPYWQDSVCNAKLAQIREQVSGRRTYTANDLQNYLHRIGSRVAIALNIEEWAHYMLNPQSPTKSINPPTWNDMDTGEFADAIFQADVFLANARQFPLPKGLLDFVSRAARCVQLPEPADSGRGNPIVVMNQITDTPAGTYDWEFFTNDRLAELFNVQLDTAELQLAADLLKIGSEHPKPFNGLDTSYQTIDILANMRNTRDADEDDQLVLAHGATLSGLNAAEQIYAAHAFEDIYRYTDLSQFNPEGDPDTGTDWYYLDTTQTFTYASLQLMMTRAQVRDLLRHQVTVGNDINMLVPTSGNHYLLRPAEGWAMRNAAQRVLLDL